MLVVLIGFAAADQAPAASLLPSALALSSSLLASGIAAYAFASPSLPRLAAALLLPTAAACAVRASRRGMRKAAAHASASATLAVTGVACVMLALPAMITNFAACLPLLALASPLFVSLAPAPHAAQRGEGGQLRRGPGRRWLGLAVLAASHPVAMLAAAVAMAGARAQWRR